MSENKEYKILDIQGSEYQTLYTKKFADRTVWHNHDPKKIKNHMPGTVLEIYVHEGDFVAEKEDLVDIEAMKMINKIPAPFSGKIKGVYVHPGQAIPKGMVMLEYE